MRPASAGCGLETGLLRARLLLSEQLQRVEESAVGADFVVQVITGGAPGGAQTPNHVSALDGLPGLDAERRQVPVLRFEAESMVDDDQVAVRALIARLRDAAGGRGEDRLTLLTGD